MNAPERSSAFLLDEDSGEQKCVYTADTKVSRYNHHLDFISRFCFLHMLKYSNTLLHFLISVPYPPRLQMLEPFDSIKKIIQSGTY